MKNPLLFLLVLCLTGIFFTGKAALNALNGNVGEQTNQSDNSSDWWATAT
jgi:hypothetical protein